jgi:shikimate kinase
MKTVYMLIGPKGTGKSHVGRAIEERLGVPFLRVEPIWLSLAPGEDGWKKVEDAIDQCFEKADELLIESLGAGEGFQSMRQSLLRQYNVRYIKVETRLDECLRRVRTRSQADHIPVSDDKVEQYNQIAAKVELPWNAVLQNDGPASIEQIVGVFQQVRAAE